MASGREVPRFVVVCSTKGRPAISAAKGKTAVAKIGRSISDNACYWGKN